VKINFSHTLVRCDLFEKICDHTYWSNAHPYANTDFKAGDIIFCKTDEILRFFERLRLTRKRVVLVTGESDYPCDALRQQFLPPHVIRWFAVNVTHPHPRVTALPLGLGGIKDAVTLHLKEMEGLQNENLSRDQWLYINFRPETNSAIRQKIYDAFKNRAEQEHWITFEPPKNHGNNEKFLTQLRRHRFVLAPPGNGIDTHRLWESLALGAYPIALRSSVLEPFEKLPVLFVDDYNEVTLDFLKKNLDQLEEKKKNQVMIQMDFWREKIKDAKANLRGKDKLTWKEWLSESFLYGWGMIKRRF